MKAPGEMARASLAEAHRGLALPAPISIAGTVDGNSAVRKSTSEHLDRPRSFRVVAVVSTELVWTLAQDEQQERAASTISLPVTRSKR